MNGNLIYSELCLFGCFFLINFSFYVCWCLLLIANIEKELEFYIFFNKILKTKQKQNLLFDISEFLNSFVLIKLISNQFLVK